MNLPFEDCHKCPALKCCDAFTVGEHMVTKFKCLNGDKMCIEGGCKVTRKIENLLRSSHLPIQYSKANLLYYREDSDNQLAIKKLNPLIHNIAQVVKEGTNFFFSGGTGTGKTYHAAMLLNHFIYKNANIHTFGGYDANFTVFPVLMNNLRYNREDKNVQFSLHEIMDVPLLVLDDVGAGTISDFVREQMYLVVNHRYNNKLSTIITSNLDLGHLADDNKLGARIVSRIAENVVAIEFLGDDRRVQR